MDISNLPSLGPLRFVTTAADETTLSFVDSIQDGYATNYIQHIDSTTGNDGKIHAGFVIDTDWTPTATSFTTQAVAFYCSAQLTSTYDTTQSPHQFYTRIDIAANATVTGLKNTVDVVGNTTYASQIFGEVLTITNSALQPSFLVYGRYDRIFSTGTSSLITGVIGHYIEGVATSGGIIENFTGIYIGGPSSGAILNIGIKSTCTENRFTGKVMIGSDSSPLARLHFAANSGFQGYTPIRIDPGTKVIAPENGAFEHIAGCLYFTTLGATRSALTPHTKWVTSTTSFTSTTTLADIAGLIGFVLQADTTYKIEGVIIATSASGTPDLNIGFDFSQAPQSIAIGYGSASDEGIITADNTNSALIAIALTTATVVHIKGTFKTNATTGGVVAARGSQHTTNGNAVVVEIGSYLTILPLETYKISGEYNITASASGSAVGNATKTAVGAAAGTSDALAVGIAGGVGVGSAAGSCTVTFDGSIV